MVKKWVNVEELLRAKSPKVYKFLPRFLINYVRRVIHEDDINWVLDRNHHHKGIEFAKAALHDMGVTVKVDGTNNIPKTGGYIFACNHPLGGLDGLAIILALSHVRRDIKFFVNELLLNLKPMDNIFVPVNIYGHNSRKMLEEIETIYKSDMALPIFPSGLVSRRQPDKSIRDLTWKKSFITKAKHYKKDVVPVWVEGKNSDFFYNFAYWRKKLGVKINIEMFFLPDEMFKQKDKHIIVHFGKPVPYTTFNESVSDSAWAVRFQHELYDKKGNIVTERLFDK